MNMGYLVKYKEKTDNFYRKSVNGSFTDVKMTLATKPALIQMIMSWNYKILSAHLVDMDQYRMNCSELIELVVEV